MRHEQRIITDASRMFDLRQGELCADFSLSLSELRFIAD